MKTMKGMLMAWIAFAIALLFLISGFGVGADPRSSVNLALFSMSFPVWVILLVIVTLVSAILKARWAFGISVAAWIIGWGNVCTLNPWNLRQNASENEKTFKLLTYNVFKFQPDERDSLLTYNNTVSSIINCGADVVALQESISLDKPTRYLKITESQCDSIKNIYPHRQYNRDGLSLLSKYPFRAISLPEYPSGSAQFAGYEIDLDSVKKTALFNVHLQSFRLNTEDRQVYYEITDGDVSKEILSEAKNEIIPKVKNALRCHASEAEMLVRDINAVSPNGAVIVCGDFNDIPGSYPIKTLCHGCELKDAFRNGAFGATYTYHGSRFYFNIDHVLYRDFERPLYTKRLKLPSSDHYPVITEFIIK